MITVILILAIIGMVSLFSVQNVTTISISFMFWRFETTLPVLLCIAVLLGMILEQLVRQWMSRRRANVKKP